MRLTGMYITLILADTSTDIIAAFRTVAVVAAPAAAAAIQAIQETPAVRAPHQLD